MTPVVRGLLWSVVYLLAAIAPLFFMIVGDAPPGRGWWTDLSMGLGFVGLAMLGLQFAVTARFNPVDAPYGLDVVLQFHRQISLVAFAFILAHPAILFVGDPQLLRLLNPVTATAPARWGLVSLVGLVVIIATSLWRRQLRLRYETWRVLHGVLAFVIVATAVVHVELVGYYVSGPWRRALWVAMSLVLLGLLVYVRLIKPVQLLRRPYRIASVRPVGAETWTLRLEPDGHAGVRFSPGQFGWLIVDRSPLSVREHPFSFSSSAEDHSGVDFTIKEAGDFTATVGDIAPGTRAYVDGPYGAFSYERNEAAGFVFVAGGVGITPVISMLRTLADLEDRRPMWLFYANPAEDGVIFRSELDGLCDRLDLRLVEILEDPPEGWAGEQGFVTPEILDRHLPERDERLQYFICGPEPMMAAVEQALHDRGIPADHVNLERFDFIE